MDGFVQEPKALPLTYFLKHRSPAPPGPEVVFGDVVLGIKALRNLVIAQ